MASFTVFIARLCLAAIFLVAGSGKLMNRAATLQHMEAHHIPNAAILIWVAAAAEILGGLSVLFGVKARVGAVILILFLIPTTVIFHTNFAEPTQRIMFLKNLGILGGLLLVAYHGAGPGSFDQGSSRNSGVVS